MNTRSADGSGRGPKRPNGRHRTAGGERQAPEIGRRKARHLEVCLDPERYRVESPFDAGFRGVRFLHTALPEISEDEIDTSVAFLGQRIRLPLFISCMTGGADRGREANRMLARAAQAAGIPIGMGSIRILFDHPELMDHFSLKPLAPDVPVIANIGAVQVRDVGPRPLIELNERLEVQALAVHLNPGQELFQPGGDRDFRGLLDAIARLCDAAPFPVIVKETGFGIRPRLVRELLDRGAAYVDLAGAGGTNWVLVEAERLPEGIDREAAREFAAWGIPTAPLLAILGGRLPRGAAVPSAGRIIASGGVRSGMDVAAAVALGADLAGIALPFIRAVLGEGEDAVLRLIERTERVFRSVLLLTGSRTPADLRRVPLLLDPSLERDALALAAAEAESAVAAEYDRAVERRHE